MKELTKDSIVTCKSYKGEWNIVKSINKEWYLCYSKQLRHSAVLNVKELKKV